MDLSTINKKVLSGKYQHPNDFAADIELIVSNCITYNSSEHDISKLAIKLKEVFKSKFEKINNDLSEEDTENEEEIEEGETEPRKVNISLFSFFSLSPIFFFFFFFSFFSFSFPSF